MNTLTIDSRTRRSLRASAAALTIGLLWSCGDAPGNPPDALPCPPQRPCPADSRPPIAPGELLSADTVPPPPTGPGPRIWRPVRATGAIHLVLDASLSADCTVPETRAAIEGRAIVLETVTGPAHPAACDGRHHPRYEVRRLTVPAGGYLIRWAVDGAPVYRGAVASDAASAIR